MYTLNLNPDELLTTTRTVRKRLDFNRPVEESVIRECVEIAMQAPSGSNQQAWQFVFVTDPQKRQAVSAYYKKAVDEYLSSEWAAGKLFADNPERHAVQQKVQDSVAYLGDHMQDAPVLFIPCFKGRPDGRPASSQASPWGSIIPATWSFMLAARARGLGTAWTTLHLRYEREVADLLGIPYEQYTQVSLIPVAYTIGTDFKPAKRENPDSVMHWNKW